MDRLMQKMEGLRGEEIRLATCRCGGDALYRAGAAQIFHCDKCDWNTGLYQSAYDAVDAWQKRNQITDALCEDCPPQNYPTDKTRCLPCPRRTDIVEVLQVHARMSSAGFETCKVMEDAAEIIRLRRVASVASGMTEREAKAEVIMVTDSCGCVFCNLDLEPYLAQRKPNQVAAYWHDTKHGAVKCTKLR